MLAALRVPLARWQWGCALFLLPVFKQTPVSIFRNLSCQGGPQLKGCRHPTHPTMLPLGLILFPQKWKVMF